MQVQTIYNLLRNELSHSPRQYIDVRSKSQSKLPVKYKRRQTMFDMIQKQSMKIPGPGKYTINPQNQKIAKKIIKKLNFDEQAKKPSNNYLDQQIKKKKAVPGIGKYELEKDNTEKIRLWHQILAKKVRKQAPLFRPTLFDDNQIDCINIGPGAYNINEPRQKQFSTINATGLKSNAKPDANQEAKNKRSQSLPKLPTPQTYNPIPAQYNTFDGMQSQHEKEAKNSFLGKKKRFSAVKYLSPGPKYSLIANWSPKNKGGKEVINIFKSTKSIKQPSVYH